jgi:hypothetical protein
MLTAKETQVQQGESIQLWDQVVWMSNGGEDICCALEQWMVKWSLFNKYSDAPKETTDDFRLFAPQFDQEFE